ncbi:hypothetical protein AmDm5_1575 [Acetobacter malorum]|nr:hypothetical protein AmDm5_1575 [Acetobacter malorum]
MITAAHLQLVQSPITNLVPNVSTSVTVKLDDTNYLVWHYQLRLLLESHGILGFVDGSKLCPSRFVDEPDKEGVETENYQIWKLHDRALMQLIIDTLSPTAMSCIIGCTSAHEIWINLRDRFSTVTKASIFQMKLELQNIQKGSESISKYFQRIKDVRDHLSAAGVSFDDDDIVILALKGLPSEYNTFRTVIRGRENVISLKDFRAQLLAEEATIENNQFSGSFTTAMLAQGNESKGKGLMLEEGSSHSKGFSPPHSGPYHGSSSNQGASSGSYNSNGPPYPSGGFRGFHNNRGRARGRNNSSSNFRFSGNNSPGILGPARPHISTCSDHGNGVPTCQICNKRGHVASDCFQRHSSTNRPSFSLQCQICWKFGHSALQCYHRANFSYQGRSPPSTLTVMHANYQPSAPLDQFWVADTGATSHMTSDLTNLTQATPFLGADTITTASGSGLPISHTGSSFLHVPQYAFQLKDILHVPQISQHLLSMYKLCKDNNCRFICDEFCFWIQDKITGTILLQGLCRDGLYPIPFHIPQHILPKASHTSHSLTNNQTCFLGHHINTSLWHNRLGHPSNAVVSTMLNQSQISFSVDPSKHVCISCLEGKCTKLPFSFPAHKSVKPFEVLHSDVWGPSPTMSVEGYKFYVLFIDECTRFTWIFPLRNKSEVFQVFVHFHAFISTQFSTSVKTFQSDGGGEYCSTRFQQFLLDKGIIHHKSCPHTPEQNGLAERKHMHIVETALTLLSTAQLPPQFWFHACAISVYLINRMPCSTLSMKSPYTCLFAQPSALTHLKVFGYSCYPLLKPYNTNKLQPKTVQCIFLGYAGQYKGYICFNPLSGRFYVSRHVVFYETNFPYKHLLVKPSQCSPVFVTPPSITPLVTGQNVVVSPHTSASHASLPLSQPTRASEFLHEPTSASEFLASPIRVPEFSSSSPPLPDPIYHASESLTSLSPTVPASSPSTQSPVPADPDFQPENLTIVLPVHSVSLHPMQTRSKSGIIKKKAFVASISSVGQSDVEPSTFKAASKIVEWQSAMQDEIDALHAQHTWDLVPLPSGKNLVGCKWVYRVKKNPDGSIARYKARLVAKGYNQEEGIDYGETFSPVVKPTTVRLILALAAQFRWSLRQLDVKNAFLHGDLHEEMYMSQPPGFGSPHHPSHFVYKLHKSLYGLKQAPRAWNDKFTSFLPGLGFQASLADPSLFVKHTSLGIVVLLLYVDDIIITGSSSSDIEIVILALTKAFDMKDLGQLHYFLGLQISYHSTGLFVSQQKYVRELLARVDMSNSKPCATPCLPSHRLLKDDGDPYHSPDQYRSIVGALQYLTFTRPDIAFAVNQCCQFMHQPMTSHVVAVKRILRYLSGTIHYGINFQSGPFSLHAYSDADWAGDPND